MTDLRTILGNKYDDTIEKVAHAIAGDATTDYLGCGCCTIYDYDEAVKRTGHDVRAYMAAHDALAAVLPDLLTEAWDEGRRLGLRQANWAPALNMTEARDNARAEVERLTAVVERVRELADYVEVETDPVEFRDADTGVWWGMSDAIRAALDGECAQDATDEDGRPLYPEHQPTEKRRDPARCGHCGQTTEGA